jgi:hypothetical protein
MTASVNAVRGTGWMTSPTYVNCQSIVTIDKPKTLIRLEPKGNAVGCLAAPARHTNMKAAGVKAGANSFMSLESNVVNPTFRSGGSIGAGASARNAVGMVGRGDWRKRRPFCNGTDRSCNMTLPRKRADFQMVVHDEKTSKTFTGGNRK